MELIGRAGLDQLDQERCVIRRSRHKAACCAIARDNNGIWLGEPLRLAMFPVCRGEISFVLLAPDVKARIHMKRPQQALLHVICEIRSAKSDVAFKFSAVSVVHMTGHLCNDRLQIAEAFAGVAEFASGRKSYGHRLV